MPIVARGAGGTAQKVGRCQRWSSSLRAPQALDTTYAPLQTLKPQADIFISPRTKAIASCYVRSIAIKQHKIRSLFTAVGQQKPTGSQPAALTLSATGFEAHQSPSETWTF